MLHACITCKKKIALPNGDKWVCLGLTELGYTVLICEECLNFKAKILRNNKKVCKCGDTARPEETIGIRIDEKIEEFPPAYEEREYLLRL